MADCKHEKREWRPDPRYYGSKVVTCVACGAKGLDLIMQIALAKRPLVDDRCYELAEAMLSTVRKPTEDEIWSLAGAIQQVCEDHCNEIEAAEPASPSQNGGA